MAAKLYIESEGDELVIGNVINDLDVKIVITQGNPVLVIDGTIYTEFSSNGGEWDEQGLKDFFYGFSNCLNVFGIRLDKR